MQLEFGGRRYAVVAADVLIGSGPDSTLLLREPGVLPRHAVVRALGDGMAVVTPATPDAEILVNGARLGVHPSPLMHGDKIRIGGQELTIADPRRDGPTRLLTAMRQRSPERRYYRAERVRSPQPAPVPGFPTLAVILVKSGQLQGERLTVRSPVANIGRAEYNDLRLPDPSISAGHAKLQLREGVWTLCDLGSTNGSKVDDEAVIGEMPLSPGATISLGEVRLFFEPRDTAPRIAVGTVVLEAQRPAEAPAMQPPPRRHPPVWSVPRRRRRRPLLLLAVVVLGALLLTGYLLLG